MNTPILSIGDVYHHSEVQLFLITITTMVNGDDAEPVLQNVLLWTFARLFDWVITLLHDAVADGDDHHHTSL